MNALPVPLGVALGVIFVVGAIVGSFLNVCVYRLPWQKSLLWPGSRCPVCLAAIRWYDNIPIVSWLVLGGRCRDCDARFSARYMVVEAFTGAVFAGLLWAEVVHAVRHVGPVGLGQLCFEYVYHVALVCLLIVATLIDLDWQIIPDSVTVPGMVIGLAGAFAVPAVYPAAVRLEWPVAGWLAAHPHWQALWTSVVGLLVGGAIVWVVRYFGSLALSKEAMGSGDVTLLAMIGSFLGWEAAVIVFFVAPFFGLLAGVVQWIAHRDSVIPYGPYLSMAAALVVVAWVPIWNGVGPMFALGWLLAGLFGAGIALLVVLLLAWRLAARAFR